MLSSFSVSACSIALLILLSTVTNVAAQQSLRVTPATELERKLQSQSACSKCITWWIKNRDRSWINQLPRCPCRLASSNFWPCTVRADCSNYWSGNVKGISWNTDPAANSCIDFGYHPGAYACIRQSVSGSRPNQ